MIHENILSNASFVGVQQIREMFELIFKRTGRSQEKESALLMTPFVEGRGFPAVLETKLRFPWCAQCSNIWLTHSQKCERHRFSR